MEAISAEVVIDPQFSGGEGRVHGGVVAGLFDDVLSHFVTVLGIPAVTGSLTIAYHSPTPTGVPVTFQARLQHRGDRNVVIAGEARHGDIVTASAEMLMIVVDEDRFARHTTRRPGSQ